MYVLWPFAATGPAREYHHLAPGGQKVSRQDLSDVPIATGKNDAMRKRFLH
jgi:hypothetical protein